MGVPQLADLVLETANAPGTGIITLGGAPDGRQTFADAFPAGGEVFYYASDGAQTEWGVGTLTVGSPNTLVRTKVLGNLFGTENALNFTSGITVWCEVPAQCAPSLDDTGLLPVSGSPDYDRDVALSAKAAEKRYLALGSNSPQTISGPVQIEDVAQFSKAVTITGDQPTIHFTRSGEPQWDVWVGDDGILYIRSFDLNGKFITDYARFKPGVGIEFVPEVTLSGGAIVPDITDFTSKGALSAKTADGRYIKSVLADGTTNARITDIQEDASGNLIVTRSDGTTASYSPSSWGTITNGWWYKVGGMLTQVFTFSNKSTSAVVFPIAFSDKPIIHPTGIDSSVVQASVGYESIKPTGFTVTAWWAGGSSGFNWNWTGTLMITATGPA